MTETVSMEELQKQPGAVIRQVCASKEPLFIEQNGSASVLMIDADTYLTKMQALEEFERIYADGVQGKPVEDAAAPKATADASGSKVRWRCKVCGFEIEMDELPDDYQCPVCGVGKEMFERV